MLNQQNMVGKLIVVFQRKRTGEEVGERRKVIIGGSFNGFARDNIDSIVDAIIMCFTFRSIEERPEIQSSEI